MHLGTPMSHKTIAGGADDPYGRVPLEAGPSGMAPALRQPDRAPEPAESPHRHTGARGAGKSPKPKGRPTAAKVTRPAAEPQGDQSSDTRGETCETESSSAKAARLGAHLRMVRKRQGMSQQAAAEALGVTRAAIAHMESGKLSVTAIEIIKLATTQKCAEMALLGIDVSLSLDDLHGMLLRELPELKGENKAGIEMRRAISLCQEGSLVRGFLGRPIEPGIPSYASRMTKAVDAIRQGEAAAEAERHRLGLGEAPVPNIAELLCGQGIWAMATELPGELSGVFACHPSIGLMTLANRKHRHVRRRFSHSHEYAHALFDRDTFVTATRKSGSADLKEIRANSFAAAFLMPRDGVEKQLELMGKGLPSRRTHILYDVANDSSSKAVALPRPRSQSISFTDVAAMTRHFGASYEAVVWRLLNLAHIDAKDCKALLQEKGLGKRYADLIGTAGQAEGGQGPDASFREMHAQLASLAVEAHRQGKISQGRVMKIGRDLQIDSMEFLEMAAVSRRK